jgi:hypothetical protein
MMRSQIRTSIARRRGNGLMSDWMKWNQTQLQAKPAFPLEDDEPKPAQIQGRQDDDSASE